MAYHISPNGSSLCQAKKGRCPYGANGEDHYETSAEANAVYEERMAKTFGHFDAIKKTAKQKRKEVGYAVRDVTRMAAYAVKASPQAQVAAAGVQALKKAPVKILTAVFAARNLSVMAFGEVTRFGTLFKGEVNETVARVKRNYADYTAKAKEEKLREARRIWEQQQARIAQKEASKKAAQDERLHVQSLSEKFGTPVKARTAENFQVGDKLENGITVTRVRTVNGKIVIGTRDPSTGRFGKTFTLEPHHKFLVARPKRQEARRVNQTIGSATSAVQARAIVLASHAKARTSGLLDTAKARVKAASQLQKESMLALRGIDRTVIAQKNTQSSTVLSDVQAVRKFKLAA